METKSEKEIVKAYTVGDPDSLVVVIPHKLRKRHGFKPGTRFVVSSDRTGTITLKPLRL